MLDAEAYARGTTVYLQDRRLDMLPALLSEQLCSLRSNTDRLVVSVVWTLDPALHAIKTWFGRSLIRFATSCSRGVLGLTRAAQAPQNIAQVAQAGAQGSMVCAAS